MSQRICCHFDIRAYANRIPKGGHQEAINVRGIDDEGVPGPRRVEGDR